MAEAESEIIAGFHTEYSGMKFAMFFIAEYANMFLVGVIGATLFLGGWSSPFGDFMNSGPFQVFWIFAKAFTLIFLQMWIRWTLPRVRVENEDLAVIRQLHVEPRDRQPDGAEPDPMVGYPRDDAARLGLAVAFH